MVGGLIIALDAVLKVDDSFRTLAGALEFF
jgi:hypothetical protein